MPFSHDSRCELVVVEKNEFFFSFIRQCLCRCFVWMNHI